MAKLIQKGKRKALKAIVQKARVGREEGFIVKL